MATNVQQRQILQIMSWCLEDQYFNFCVNFFKNELKKKRSANVLFESFNTEAKMHTLKSKLEELNPEDCYGLYCKLFQEKKNRESNHNPCQLEINATSIALETMNFPNFGLFKPFVDLLKNLFSPHRGGLLDSMFKMFNQAKTYFNPEVSLTTEEAESSPYSELFTAAASTINKKYNKLYRNFITKNYSDEQILYGYMKELSNEEAYTLTNHKLFQQVESKILKIIGKNNLTAAGVEDALASKVKYNLTQVHEFCLKAYADQADLDSYLNQINSVGLIIKDLGLKIKQQELELRKMRDVTAESSLEIKEKQLNLYKSIRNNKKKLYHFLLKTEAWRKCDILSPGKRPFSYEYIQEQFKKFPQKDLAVHAISQENGDYALSRYEFAPELKHKGILKLFEYNQATLHNDSYMNTELKKLQSEDITNLTDQYKNFQKDLNLLHKRKDAMLIYLSNSKERNGVTAFEFEKKIAELQGELAVILELEKDLHNKLKSFEDDNVALLQDLNADNQQAIASSGFIKLKQAATNLIKLVTYSKEKIKESSYFNPRGEDLQFQPQEGGPFSRSSLVRP